MIQFLIAILLGLACNSGNTTGHGDSNSGYTTFNETGGENGQIPPPPITDPDPGGD